MCPFQFIQNDTSDIVPFQRKNSSNDVNAETDPQQLREWLKEMRLKVHMRLVQRQQVTNITNPTEGYTLTCTDNKLDKSVSEKKKGGLDADKKKGNDTERRKGSESERKKGSDSDRKKGNDTERKKQETERKKKGDAFDAFAVPTPLPRSSTETRVSSTQIDTHTSFPSTTKSPNQKDKKTDYTPTRKPTRLSKMPPQNKNSSPRNKNSPQQQQQHQQHQHQHQHQQQQQGPNPFQEGNAPLFQARKNPTLTRRTYSEYDVRRVRIKARNSVGFEPAW